LHGRRVRANRVGNEVPDRSQTRRGRIVIDREQRSALHAELRTRLSGVGDIHLLLERGDHAEARRLAAAFREDLALLDDLGWADEDPREHYELTMAPEALAAVAARLHRESAGFLATHLARPRDEEALAERSLKATEACASILSDLAEAGVGPAGPGPVEA